MKSVKGVAVIIFFISLITLGMYVLVNFQSESIAAVDSSEAVQAQPDRELCARLVRFGQVAFDRGQFAEAKHFFQKAIMVDPNHLPAWKKYNHALLALISAKVETDPAFLPELEPDTDSGTEASSPTSSDQMNDDDGC